MSTTPEAVRALLASSDTGERLRGVNELRQLERGPAYELAQSVLQDEHPRVRYSAVSQLGTLGRQDPQQTLPLLRDRLLHDPEPDIKAAAADAIGGLQLREAYPDLERLYRETEEWLVQFSIVAALGELGDPRGFELLQQALESDTALICTAAIGALGELGDARAVELLRPYVSDPDWQRRSRAVRALAQIGTEEARALIEPLTQDEVEQVAQHARESLAQLHSPSA
jgi:HEAT repeat protein